MYAYVAYSNKLSEWVFDLLSILIGVTHPETTIQGVSGVGVWCEWVLLVDGDPV